ncbi:hypothetical protein [Nucisporomicrobium flavum]|uniref:hypothetical protein n=1 Tax=Nucisporomicrobium flavum TaxID=2785915 RepID=UPI0018F53B7A|nr:hypothetical protein [Nucisporomicrobium flavum]
MTDFFDRLLARRRPLDEPGTVTRARPRVPTLFERSRATGLEEISVERPAATPPAVVAPPSAPVAPPPPGRPSQPAPPVPNTRFAAPLPESGPAPAVATTTATGEPAAPVLTPRAVVHAPMLPPPAAPRIETPSIPVPAAALVAPAPQLVAPSEPRVAPVTPPATPGSPAFAVAPDGRTRRAEPAGRTVRVHIGRIEVSAPPAPDSRPERAQRRTPDLTLDKYLGEGGVR